MKSTLALVLVIPVLMTITVLNNDVKAQNITVIQKRCENGVCGESKYFGGIALRGRSRTYSREEDRKKRTTNVIPL